MSDDFAKTFRMTIEDLMYHNQNREVLVCIQIRDYEELVHRTFDCFVGVDYKLDPKPKVWDCGSFKIKFLTTPDLERGLIYVFQDQFVTTITFH